MKMVAMGIRAPIPRKTEVLASSSMARPATWLITARVMIIIISTGMPTPKICT